MFVPDIISEMETLQEAFCAIKYLFYAGNFRINFLFLFFLIS
jgi:hypothetical protein